MLGHSGASDAILGRRLEDLPARTRLRIRRAPFLLRGEALEAVILESSGEPFTLLMIEDDAEFREATARVLQARGYRVLTAEDGEQAIDLFQKRSEPIDLVISDVVMPKVSGDEFYLILQQLSPKTRFLLISGHSPREVLELTSLGPEVPLITKPWTSQELLQKIESILKK